jgi:hypothetical protein
LSPGGTLLVSRVNQEPFWNLPNAFVVHTCMYGYRPQALIAIRAPQDEDG